MIIGISIVLTECCSRQLFINPFSEPGNSYKVWARATMQFVVDRWLAEAWTRRRFFGYTMATAKTGNSYEDVLILLSVGEWSSTVSLYKHKIYRVFLSTVTQINLVWGPLKCTKSNFNPVHVFFHFGTFCLVVLQLILASKLSK